MKYHIAGYLAGENFREHYISLVIAECVLCKNLLSSNRYCASACGALSYHKFVKLFNMKICFQTIRDGFLLQNKFAMQ